MSSRWTIDVWLFGFYRKLGLGPDQSHCNQSRRWSWLQTTLAQITPIAPKWLYNALKIFSQFTILSNLRLPWKKNTVLPWKFSLYWIYFLHSGFLTTCACPEDKFSPEIFHCVEIFFYYPRLLSNGACPEILHCIEYTFYIEEFEQLAIALKSIGWPEFIARNMYFLLLRIFEQLGRALKNSCPGIFHYFKFL